MELERSRCSELSRLSHLGLLFRRGQVRRAHAALFPWVVVHPSDREPAIEAGHLERSHGRLRPDDDDQLAPSGMLAPARSKEQGERGRVDEGDRAEVDREAAHFFARNLTAIDGAPADCGFGPIAVQQGSNRPCQGFLDFRGAVAVELAS